VFLQQRMQLCLSLRVSGSKLLLGESCLLLLSHAAVVLHVALLRHLLHLLVCLLLLLLLEAWVRVSHLRRGLLHIHAWTARVATHLLSLCHCILHLV
jgi:hypothetical protein